MWNREKQSLLDARTHSLEQAEERIEELATLKNYYKNIVEEQKGTITKQEDLINSFIRELYSNIKTDKQIVDTLKEVIRRQTK